MAEHTPSRSEAIARVAELIKDIRIAMLTTTGTDGALHSRPMATQQASFDGTLWFLTREDSGKVDEIRSEAEVNLTYAGENHAYISISGRAQVNRDQAKVDELWNPMYKAWFPEGKDDPSIRVLRVDADFAEYWEAPSNAIVRNYQILKAAVTGGQTKVGEHQKLPLEKAS